MTKAERNASRAFQAIKAYAKAVKTPIADSEVLLTDLLADLRFWAAKKNLSFYEINRRALYHYDAETKGEE